MQQRSKGHPQAQRGDLEHSCAKSRQLDSLYRELPYCLPRRPNRTRVLQGVGRFCPTLKAPLDWSANEPLGPSSLRTQNRGTLVTWVTSLYRQQVGTGGCALPETGAHSLAHSQTRALSHTKLQHFHKTRGRGLHASQTPHQRFLISTEGNSQDTPNQKSMYGTTFI